MFQSMRSAHLILRIALALVFLWFGVHAFIEPQYSADAWLPQSASQTLIPLIGIFQVLVAVSLAGGFFVRSFAIAATVFLAITFFFHGLTDATIRDVGLIGALVTLALWPDRTY
jgi:uncharacterized membrane protein YphA (DoxX/SURF4 family)